MKDKIFGVLQRVGRSFMLPIAILPVAGLLLGLGSSFTNTTTIETYGLQWLLGDKTILHALLVIMNAVGSAIFDNLPLIFAVGVAIGMAKKEKEVSALSAVIAYFVMNVSINAMLKISGKILADGSIAKDVLDGTITSVCGIQSLQMGVFGGIIVGLGVAALHNRFYKIELPNALSFFGGNKICAYHFNSGISFCRNLNVFYLAYCAERNLCTRRSGDRNRIFRNTSLWYYKESSYSIRTAPCILHAVLADSSRWNDGGCWTYG